MNERIQELAEQAEDLAFDEVDSGSEFHPAFCRILAELVVRECAMLVETLSPGYNDYRDQIENAFRRDCVDNIKQHFGFE